MNNCKLQHVTLHYIQSGRKSIHGSEYSGQFTVLKDVVIFLGQVVKIRDFPE